MLDELMRDPKVPAHSVFEITVVSKKFRVALVVESDFVHRKSEKRFKRI